MKALPEYNLHVLVFILTQSYVNVDSHHVLAANNCISGLHAEKAWLDHGICDIIIFLTEIMKTV